MQTHKSNKLKNYLKLIRIRQWVKNGFVFAAIIFSGNLLNTHKFILTCATFVLFCLTASSIYIINDIKDINEDRNHPVKRFRPLASGVIKVTNAKIVLVCFISIFLVSSFLMNYKLFLILLLYFIINLLYTYYLKNYIIIDVMIISFGFILRVISGGIVINVNVSEWLLICTGLISLYLGFCKRKNEIIVLNDKASSHRKNLSLYSIEYLNRILSVLLGLTIMTYILYSINGTRYKRMIFTIPFVLYGTLRYEYLITDKNLGGSPEDIFIKDKPFLINIIIWIGISILSIYCI